MGDLKTTDSPLVIGDLKKRFLHLSYYVCIANIPRQFEHGFWPGKRSMSKTTSIDLLETDSEWPNIGDRLFSEGDPAQGAFLANHPVERRHHLIEGYKQAADLLVEKTEIEAWRSRKLVYPIVFCYRHFLELTLKAILEDYGSMGDVTRKRTHHKLEDLWEDFRTLLRNLDSDHLQEKATDAVEYCIAEFEKIDPFSDAFRYPDRKGQPFDIDHESIDLPHLRDTVQVIENYFMASDAFLSELKDAPPDEYLAFL